VIGVTGVIGELKSATWIDLVTIDATSPRTTARFWCAFVDLEVQLDEDVGRWVVLEDRVGHRVLGLQRSDTRELVHRRHGRITLEVAVPPDLIEAEIIRAVSLGASDVGHGLLTDPDGTPFRLVPTTRPSSYFDVAMFDVLNPADTAEFWMAAAGLVQLDPSNQHPSNQHFGEQVVDRSVERVVLGTPTGTRLVGFQRVTAASLGTRTRDRVHIDLECPLESFAREVDRMIDLGAVRIGPARVEHFATSQIFTDPNGLVFCQNGYTRSELSSRTTASLARGRPLP
jgi:hypothetical protein